MYFDTHAHYDDAQFDSDRTALLASMPENGVSLVLNPGCDTASSETAVSLSRQFDFVYTAVGFHPHEAKGMDDTAFDRIKELASELKVKAIGEIGLDYHYDLSPRDVQKDVFARQLELARELKLPVIIHEREACADCLDIIRGFSGDVRGVFHCYSGSWETAKTILSWGWYLSFTGVVTFKNARKSHEVIKNMPRDMLMIETDSPYLAPVPNRGKRNSSLNLPYIAETIGGLIGISKDEVAELTLENGRRFFSI